MECGLVVGCRIENFLLSKDDTSSVELLDTSEYQACSSLHSLVCPFFLRRNRTEASMYKYRNRLRTLFFFSFFLFRCRSDLESRLFFFSFGSQPQRFHFFSLRPFSSRVLIRVHVQSDRYSGFEVGAQSPPHVVNLRTFSETLNAGRTCNLPSAGPQPSLPRGHPGPART